MNQSINLNELEKATWVTVFHSGCVDIMMGVIFIVGTLCHIFDDISYYLMALYLVPVLLLFAAQRYIIIPRIGLVKFHRRRRKKNLIYFAIVTTLLVILVLSTAFSNSSIIQSKYANFAIICGIILIICGSIAFFLNFNRMYIYSFVILFAFILTGIIRENPGFISRTGYAYLFPAIVMIATGIVYLRRFIKRYPLS